MLATMHSAMAPTHAHHGKLPYPSAFSSCRLIADTVGQSIFPFAWSHCNVHGGEQTALSLSLFFLKPYCRHTLQSPGPFDSFTGLIEFDRTSQDFTYDPFEDCLVILLSYWLKPLILDCPGGCNLPQKMVTDKSLEYQRSNV